MQLINGTPSGCPPTLFPLINPRRDIILCMQEQCMTLYIYTQLVSDMVAIATIPLHVQFTLHGINARIMPGSCLAN
jgi:hypothetical protein